MGNNTGDGMVNTGSKISLLYCLVNIYRFSELYNFFYDYLLYVVRFVSGEDLDIVNFFINFYKLNGSFPSIYVLREKFSIFSGLDIDSSIDKEEFKNIVSDSLLFYRVVDFKNRIFSIVNHISNDGLFDKDKVVYELNNAFTILSNSKGDGEDVLCSVKDFNFLDLYSVRESSGGGVVTGVQELDNILKGGVGFGKMFVIVAPPKSFKTTFLINMCYLNLFTECCNSLFLNLELVKDELYYKFLSRHSYSMNVNIDVVKILKGVLSEEEKCLCDRVSKDFLDKIKSELFILGLEDLDISSASMLKFFLSNFIEKNKIRVIYIDYLQLFGESRSYKNETRYDYLNSIVGVFREIAVKYRVAVVIASQLNKKGVKRAEEKGLFDVSDVSESKALLQDCSYLITLFANDNLKKTNRLAYRLIYNRDGETCESNKYTFVNPIYFLVGSGVISNLDFENINSDLLGSDEIDVLDLLDLG